MAVSNQSIIDKMRKELQRAEQLYNQPEVMKQHISRVQLLCDLLLQEEKTASGQQSEITEKEMKAMLGETEADVKTPVQPGKGHDDANGSSIFDF